MSVDASGPAQSLSLPVCDKGDLSHAHFCRRGGLETGGATTSADLAGLLHFRLRTASLVMFGGAFVFFLRNLFLGPPTEFAPALLIPVHAVMVVGLGIAAYVLSRNTEYSLDELRWIEVAVFGGVATFFCWLQFNMSWQTAAIPNIELHRAFIAQSIIPWILVSQCYGIFVPNTWKRGFVIQAIVQIAALTSVGVGVLRSPEYWNTLFTRAEWLQVVLWLNLSGAAAVWGSYRILCLNREASEAKQLGAYNLRQKLGSGGMGDVYLAEHQLLKRPCAIKLIRGPQATDPQSIARFESEVRATARLTHPHTVEIYDFGHTADGTFYYVMEFLPGMNLQELVDRYGPMSPARVIHLLRQICGALAEAHAAGLVHRDIKPGNIFAAERGGIFDYAKLLDFGLVKSTLPGPQSMQLTHIGTVLGSPLFAAPEMVTGDGVPDPRSDIYSLGATAYFLLTARPVFDGEQPLKVMFAHAQQPPVPPSQLQSGIPADLEAIVMRCLEKHAGERFADVTALESALAQCDAAGRWTKSDARNWWQSSNEPSHEQAVAQAESTVTQILGAPVS